MGKTEQPLVSVISPFYMIERYAGQCIESIIEQSYSNLEIILVDDGGSDRCSEILDLYASKDSRIRVIHKPNGGLVSARQEGLKAAHGAYIMCIDGDDWIDPGYLEAMVGAAVETGSDIVCAGFSRDRFMRTEKVREHWPAGVYEGESLTDLWKQMMSRDIFWSPGITSYLWNKLFRREVYEGPQMAVDPSISMGEDAAVSYPALLSAKRVAVIDISMYHYRQHEDSMIKHKTAYYSEAVKLRALYEFMTEWVRKTDPALGLDGRLDDMILAMALMRSGGVLPAGEFTAYDTACDGKRVVVYSASTFGQQMMNRLMKSGRCMVAGWIDEAYKEYRRVCLNVDPPEAVTALDYDYILIAKIDLAKAARIKETLVNLGVDESRILTASPRGNRKELCRRFLDAEAFQAAGL